MSLQRTTQRYANGEERPLGSYGAVMAAYAGAVGAAGALLRARRTPLPERVGAGDLALLTVATHKASRLLAKDSVTATVRAPFTTFQESAGEGEVNEAVTGRGFRHAVGELLTCPFCLSVWIATAFVVAFTVAPRATRLAASVLAATVGSDYLQFAYAAARDAVSG